MSDDPTTTTLPTGSDQQPPPVALFGMLAGMWQARAIYTAAELGVAEAVADRPRSVAELAGLTGSHPRSLYRLLRALAQIGIFEELPGRAFANSDLSYYLRPDVPGTMYAMAMGCADWGWRNWGDLTTSIRTGESAFERVHGMPMWEYFKDYNQTAGRLFNDSMTGFSAAVDEPVATAAELGGVRSIVDVGGGHGRLLRTILDAHPQIERAVLFDQSQVLKEARPLLAGADDKGRLELVGGDFFTTVPAGADVYLMKMILHDWTDDECVKILRNCRRAMNPGGRVLAAEIVLDPTSGDWFPYFLDLQILVCLSGGERTEEEFHQLYRSAGLRLTRILTTGSMFSLVEGVALEDNA